MNKTSLFWLVGASALALSACKQEPASVVYKGREFFGRDHEGVVNSDNRETFSADSPRYKRGYARPVEDAAVASVGVSELPAPVEVSENSLAPASTNSKTNSQSHFLNKQEVSGSVDVQDKPIQPVVSASREVEKAEPVLHEPAKKDPVHKAPTKGDSQFIWPVDGGKVVSHFNEGPKENGKGNDGINIAMSEGEPIFAAADGTVVYAGNELAGYGNMIILRHEGGWMTAYAHARSLAIKKGAKVKQSDLIGYVGSTGGVKTPQVHFVLRKDKTPVDPEKYLPKNG